MKRTLDTRRISLSSLESLEHFALLGPGFADSHFTLLTDLAVTDSNAAALWVTAYEGQNPTRFAAKIEPVELEFDAPTASLKCQLDETGATAAIDSIRASIARGDVYQVNFTLRAKICDATASQLFQRLCQRQVPRFAAWLKCPQFPETVSASPELLVQLEGTNLEVEPMKGTSRPEHRTALLDSVKDQAELAMITDLLRNDLQQLCVPGSVTVKNARLLLALPYAIQAVSQVTGVLRSEFDLERVLSVLHPGGSVTGAPRQAARTLISQLESTPRGLYCGNVGFQQGDRFRAALLIRTAQKVAERTFTYGVGSGITWDSEPQAEVDEMRVKLGAMV